MGTKTEPGEFDCYGAALPTEPLFTLLGRDKLAPGLVRAWADEREDAVARGEAPESDREKINEARACASRMEAWRQQNDGAWRSQNPELPLGPRFLDDVPGAVHALTDPFLEPRTADTAAVADAQRTPCQTGEPCIGGDCRCA